MKTTLTALAALLFASAGTAALAQDHDHDHGGQGGGGGDRPQAHDHGSPGGAGGGHPVAPAVAEGHARFGAPPPPGAAAPAAPAGGQHFNHDGGGHDGPRGGERHFEHGGGGVPSAPISGRPAPGDRHWDRNDAPREVVPGGAGEHGFDRQHDGHAPADRRDGRGDGRGDGHWDGRGDGRGDGRHDDHGRGDGHHFNPGRWERGRFPPVFWSPDRFHAGSYRAPYGFYARNWGFGDFLPRGWFGESYFIGDFVDYDLPYPPPGFEWVRVGDDAIMVDQYTGRIVQVVRGIFW
jgi:Ni/Co efflux regulator RcnB